MIINKGEGREKEGFLLLVRMKTASVIAVLLTLGKENSLVR